MHSSARIPQPAYSALNAALGSTRVARIAGIALAVTATSSNAAITVPNTTGMYVSEPARVVAEIGF